MAPRHQNIKRTSHNIMECVTFSHHLARDGGHTPSHSLMRVSKGGAPSNTKWRHKVMLLVQSSSSVCVKKILCTLKMPSLDTVSYGNTHVHMHARHVQMCFCTPLVLLHALQKCTTFKGKPGSLARQLQAEPSHVHHLLHVVYPFQS